ncbi:MAG: T9SS type A sorting domain-containing protein, partial [Bacteroidota bacterium]
NTPRGFDFIQGKFFVKALKNPKNEKYENRLLGELVALKLNIGASDAGVTPPNGSASVRFGDLVFDDGVNTHFLKGRTLREIAGSPVATPGVGMSPGFVDSILTYWKGFGTFTQNQFNSEFYANVADALKKVNEAFYDELVLSDTISLFPNFRLKGEKQLSEVDFLSAPSSSKRIYQPLNIFNQDYPDEFVLYQNYPNPFNPSTTIEFYLPSDSKVSLKIYNVLGQEIVTLFNNEFLDEGFNDVEFDASNLSSGVYFYRLTAIQNDTEGESNEFIQTKKLVLVK